MEAFEFNIHFLHGAIVLLFCMVLLPLILSTVLSNILAKNLQKNLIYLLLLDIFWNVLAFVEQLPESYISETSRKIVYLAGALCWVQYGYAIIRTTMGIAGESLKPFWKRILPAFRFWNAIGIVFVLATGISGRFYPEIVENWYGYTAVNSLFTVFAIVAFLVFPVICSAVISFQALHTRTHRIHRITFATFVTAIVGGVTMDALLPAMGLFLYGESAAIFMFLITIVLYRANSAISQMGIDTSGSLKLIVQELEDGVILLNSDGKIEMANPSVCKMLGFGEKILLQNPISRFIPDLRILGPLNNVPVYLNNNSLAATLSISQLYSNRILFGYKVILRDSCEKEDFQKKFSKLQAKFNDERDAIRFKIITLQQLYQTQQVFLNSLLDNIPARLWAKNLTGAYTQQNKKDIAVRGNRISIVESPEFSELETLALESSGHIVVRNETSIDENGKKHWEKQTVVPIFDEAQQIKGILGLIEDTTDFHTIEEERNQLRENLIKASNFEDMSNLAGGLAHDFNNILSGIIGYCELAQATIPATADCEKSKKYLENMRRSMNNAASLVKRTYDQLKQQEDKQEKNTENFNVGLVFDEVKNALLPMLPQNVQIFKESGDEMFAYGNPTDFHRIMMNMGKNAILAMTQSGGSLTYSCVRKDVSEQIVSQFSTVPPGSYLYISVKDTGTGMTPDVLKHVFTPYFTTRAPGQGSGIGLAVAMKLIKSAGAYVSIDTTIGKGTNFELYWPLAKQTEDKSHA